MIRARRLARLLAPPMLGVTLAALLLEVGLAALLEPADGWYIWPPGLQAELVAAPGVMPGIEGPSRFRVNSRGLRGPEPGGDARHWLFLGGSTTECLYLDEEESWPHLVGEAASARGRAPVLALNGGRSGRDLRDHVVQLERLEGQYERIFILVGVNDLLHRLAADEHFDPHTLQTRRAAVEAQAFAVRPRAASGRAWWRGLATVRTAVRLRDRLDPDSRRLTQNPGGEVYVEWRASRAAAARSLDRLPEMGAALAEYRRNLALCARLAGERGADLVLLTQPMLWRADLPAELEARLWMGWIGEGRTDPEATYYSTRALAQGMEDYNRALLARDWLETPLAGSVCDLANSVAPHGENFVDDVHFSEAGARRVAEALVAHLAERGAL